jgi:ribosomal protein S12 methylthiotransferase
MLLHVTALGCPKNRVDVETIVGLACAHGVHLTADPGDADVVLVSTCGFIEPASRESIDTVLELARLRRPGARLVVTGCLAQRFGDELGTLLPEADFLVGTADLTRVVDAILGRGDRVSVGRAGGDLRRLVTRVPSGSPGSAYVKVADGCSRHCAFCTIPAIRGPYRSRHIDDICDEARDLARAGVLELNLVAQDLTAFGRDRSNGEDLAGLLRALSRIDGLRWIRPLYLYPDRSLVPVLHAMASNPTVAPYLDLPIQHASDRVLRRMKRGHRQPLLRSLIREARRIVPGLSLRTTVIVGHPGEGPDELADLIDFVAETRFENLGAFRFSPEEGTASAGQGGVPSRRESYDRHRRVMAVQRRISRQICRGRRGQVLEVLVEGPSEDSPLVTTARHAGQAPEVDGVVYLDRPVEAGRMVRVKIIDSGDYDLVGEVLDGEAGYQT